MAGNAPIALGPGPSSDGDGDGGGKEAIALGPPSSEGVADKEVEQEGVVSVQVSEPESDGIGRGSDEQLVVIEQD